MENSGSTRHLWIAETLGYDSYARILADTVSTLHTPVNIGIYAGWGSGKTYLLRKIREILLSKRFRTTQTDVLMSIWLLIRLLFFFPPKQIKNRNETRYIAVNFNALEYAGSDHLWAGLVTKLVDAVELGFGTFASAIFRANPVNVLKESHQKKDAEDMDNEKDPKKFRTMKLCGVPWWILFIISTICALAMGIALLVYAFQTQAELKSVSEDEQPQVYPTNATMVPEDTTGLPRIAKARASLGIGGIILCIPFFRGCKIAIPVVFKIVNTQSSKVRKLVSKPDLSQELGVMAKVKSEIYHVTKLVRYMELFEGRQIIVAIFIDDLDKLPQQTIAPIMQAINILLTEPKSRFVSFVAMDPEAVSAALEMGIQSQFPAINISGHRYLKRLIQVPFSIPEMNGLEKRQLLNSLILRNETVVTKSDQTSSIVRNAISEDVTDGRGSAGTPLLTVSNDDIEMGNMLGGTPRVSPTHTAEGRMTIDLDSKTELFRKKQLHKYIDISDATEAVLTQLKSDKIFPFINTNLQEMTRLVGITKVTVRIIFCRPELIPPEITCLQVAVWIVLVAHWPYRLAWIAESVEDLELTDENNHRSLRTIYEGIEDRLTLPMKWKKLMKLDEDPDTLYRMLKLHEKWLNVAILRFFLPNTISLDRSLKDIVSTASIERQAKMAAFINMKSLITMTTDDVIRIIVSCCGISPNITRYKERCLHHNLTGITLLHCDLDQLQKNLKMTIGDWVPFERRVLYLRENSEQRMARQERFDIMKQINMTNML